MKRSLEEMLKEVCYEEDKIPDYVLPSPLKKTDGTLVKTAFEWMNVQRSKILDIYRKQVYGIALPRPDKTEYQLLSCRNNALSDTAIRKEFRLYFSMNNGSEHSATMLLYIPKNAKKPVPVFLGLCFSGNHGATEEPDVIPTGRDINNNLCYDKDACGNQAHRWQFKETIRRGYASATVCYHDFFPDFNDERAWQKSIHHLFYPKKSAAKIHSFSSAVNGWAWGLSRMLDCLETEPLVDTSKAMVHGLSRLGKAALWAGVTDIRFPLVISNCSGEGGATLFKRCFGENIELILSRFPHWFLSAMEQYSGNEQNMPFDQNFMISLLAPRKVCIASATEDAWADPKGEFLSGYHAGKVYQLFGVSGYGLHDMPLPDTPLDGPVSYHIRTGFHEQMLGDWQHYWALADNLFPQSPK